MIHEHIFRPHDLVAGHVALDLVNTVNARNTEPIDWLDGYPRLLQWANLTGEFDQRALRVLQRRSAADPVAAASALRATRRLREALFDVVTANITAKAATPDGLRRIERAWKAAVAHASLGVAAGYLRLQLSVEISGLDFLNHELAVRALDLVQALPVQRTRACPGCGWLFIDRSRGGQRRWCDMATCGNAAKSSRHYHRTRQRTPVE